MAITGKSPIVTVIGSITADDYKQEGDHTGYDCQSIVRYLSYFHTFLPYFMKNTRFHLTIPRPDIIFISRNRRMLCIQIKSIQESAIQAKRKESAAKTVLIYAQKPK